MYEAYRWVSKIRFSMVNDSPIAERSKIICNPFLKCFLPQQVSNFTKVIARTNILMTVNSVLEFQNNLWG
jgi:hypothetical protein